MAKQNTPLSARERNGMIALLTVGIILIGSGFIVRQCNHPGPIPPGVTVTSDTDTIDYYENQQDTPSSTKVRRKKHKSPTDSTSTLRSKPKANKKRPSPKTQRPASPPRNHLEEYLD